MRISRFLPLLILAIACTGLGWGLAYGASQDATPAVAETLDPDTAAAAVGGGFTYQGYLAQNGVARNGVCDFQFKLWNAATGGAQVGSTQTIAQVTLTGGRFTVLLNGSNQFGPTAFNGQARWLEIAARCTINSGYITLAPRQALTGTPYALGLRPGAVINGSLPSGAALTLNNSASDGFALRATQGGIHIDSAGDGVHVVTAGDEGFQVESAGDNGLEVQEAGDDGVHIGWAGDEGVDVVTADSIGFAITNAGKYGVYVDNAGDDGIHIDSAGDVGVQVDSADSRGFSVENAGITGYYVNKAQFGLIVSNASLDGASVHGQQNGVWASGGNFAGNFLGNVKISGSCTGCLLSTLGVNYGDRPLKPGDIVGIVGAVAGSVAGAEQVWQVAPATEGMTPIGVVAGRAEIVATQSVRAGGTQELLVPREGPAAPGDYVNIIISGPFQVRVAPGAAIVPGDYVLPADDGRVRRLDVATARVADMLSSIGIALSEPDADGLVWVLVNGH